MYSIKQTQKQIILSSDLRNHYTHDFVFSKKEMQKGDIDIVFKEKNEIKYKGKMYDIISRKSDSDSIYIHCISDEEEDFTLALSGNEIIKAQKSKDAKDLSALRLKLSNFTFERNNRQLITFVNMTKLSLSIFDKKLPHPFVHTIFSPPWC